MPELPEVENVARGLRHLEGMRLRRLELFDPKVWFESEFDATALDRRLLRQVARRGKYLLLRFDGITLIQHLRMTGKMLEERSSAIPDAVRDQIGTSGPKARQVRCRFAFEDLSIVFYDTRRFGTLTAVGDEERFFQDKGVAPDPFEQEAIARQHFRDSLARSGKPLKAALLDQSMIAGVGNIYADEALFRVGADPRLPARRWKDAEKLWDTIRALLQLSIEEGGTSVVDYLGADGLPGRFGAKLLVYGREGEPCRKCGDKIRRIPLAGRSTHFCRRCQKGYRKRPG